MWKILRLFTTNQVNWVTLFIQFSIRGLLDLSKVYDHIKTKTNRQKKQNKKNCYKLSKSLKSELFRKKFVSL